MKSSVSQPFVLYHALSVFDDRPENAGIVFTEKSLTIQSQQPESDINVIVARFMKSGNLPVRDMPPNFADWTGELTYQDAFSLVEEAKRSFFALDADVRSKFDNDPAAFVDFASNPENYAQMAKWGLAVPRESGIITPEPAIPPA